MDIVLPYIFGVLTGAIITIVGFVLTARFLQTGDLQEKLEAQRLYLSRTNENVLDVKVRVDTILQIVKEAKEEATIERDIRDSLVEEKK